MLNEVLRLTQGDLSNVIKTRKKNKTKRSAATKRFIKIIKGKIMFEVLDTVCQPTRATKYSAMVDLYARENVVIGAGETKIVPLGVKIDKGSIKDSLEDWEHIVGFMESHFIELHPRSSLRAKGLIVGVGVIDLDYPDEIGLIVNNPIKTIS